MEAIDIFFKIFSEEPSIIQSDGMGGFRVQLGEAVIEGTTEPLIDVIDKALSKYLETQGSLQ